MGNDTGQVSESYIGLLSKAKFRQWTNNVVNDHYQGKNTLSSEKAMKLCITRVAEPLYFWRVTAPAPAPGQFQKAINKKFIVTIFFIAWKEQLLKRN